MIPQYFKNVQINTICQEMEAKCQLIYSFIVNFFFMLLFFMILSNEAVRKFLLICLHIYNEQQRHLGLHGKQEIKYRTAFACEINILLEFFHFATVMVVGRCKKGCHA